MSLPAIFLVLDAATKRERIAAALHMECVASAMAAAFCGGEAAKAMKRLKDQLLSGKTPDGAEAQEQSIDAPGALAGFAGALVAAGARQGT